MPWVRLDDQFPDHPKSLAVGPLGSWLYICGLAYANRFLTDGFIPERQTKRLADIDNLLKLLLDALNGCLYDDDRQVACLSGVHRFAKSDDPHTVVRAWRSAHRA